MSDPSVEELGGFLSCVVDAGRSLLALAQPLTGDRARGKVMLKALSGQTMFVPRGAYLIPVVGGQVRPELLLKVDRGPDDDGWQVTDAGRDVDAFSNVGGSRYNLPAGTKVYLDPPNSRADVAACQVATGGLTGGTDPVGFGAVRDAVVYESMDGPVFSLDARRSMVMSFPAIVVAWASLVPPDGSSSAHASSAHRGLMRYTYSARFVVTVISSRADGDAMRRHEGLAIMNALLLLFAGRNAADGVPLSNPSALRVLEARREEGPQAEYQKFYVYNLTVSAEVSLRSFDQRTLADWLRSSVSAVAPQFPAADDQGPYPVVTDDVVIMQPDEVVWDGNDVIWDNLVVRAEP